VAPALGYHAMRMRWCRAALWAFVRRWAVYLVVAAVVFAAGMPGGVGGALGAVQGLCAWLVLPLFHAMTEPAWIVPAVVLHALAGAGLVQGMRPLLWPSRWAAAERALPIDAAETLRSDARVVPMGLLPWMLPCGLGAQALLASHPAWLQPVRGRAVLALVVALAGSVLLGVAMLQWLRRAPRPVAAQARELAPSLPRAVASIAHAGWPLALIGWPLWRGPAKRSGRLLAAGALVLCAPAIGLVQWPQAGGWWLAAYAGGAFGIVTRLNGLARLELTPLLDACLPLPLSPAALQRGRAALALVPLALSGVVLLVALAQVPVRSWVLLGYALACAASCAVEVASAPADAAEKASRWLFCLALMFALGSEVMA
jgi:hypothetical protein